MSQAIVNPAELRRFAQQLKHFNTELVTQMSAIQRQMVALGSTWRDQEQQKFTEEFEQQMKTINRFVESSEQYVPFLLRKAERIDEYLQQR
ncbi:MAG: WXG100 family type VII secretion target [Planctomycetota bacterium]|nr:WXG100 family type VII secretion target [Planctomycetota bacterium]